VSTPLCRVRWQLRRNGFHALAGAALEAPTGPPWPAAGVAMRRLQRCSRLTGGTCLQCALALLRTAARRGVEGRLVLGAQRDGGRMHAHAWVCFGAESYGDTQRDGRQFDAFPPPGRSGSGPADAEPVDTFGAQP
jgi:hypothetical protein